jgi:transketolase
MIWGAAAISHPSVRLVGSHAGVEIGADGPSQMGLEDLAMMRGVLDLYSIKPIDADALVEAAAASGGRLVVAEDHHPEGGLGSAVVAALLKAGVQQLRLAHLSVSELPGSGTTAELLAAAGIDAAHIASAAAALIDE